MRRRAPARRFLLSQLSLRPGVAWLVAAAIALGVLPIHSALERHGALDGPTQVWLTDCSHEPVRHLESATPVELPWCPACLLQLQSVGALLDAPRPGALLARLGDAVPPGEPALAAAPLRLPASRGPPLV